MISNYTSETRGEPTPTTAVVAGDVTLVSWATGRHRRRGEPSHKYARLRNSSSTGSFVSYSLSISVHICHHPKQGLTLVWIWWVGVLASQAYTTLHRDEIEYR